MFYEMNMYLFIKSYRLHFSLLGASFSILSVSTPSLFISFIITMLGDGLPLIAEKLKLLDNGD